MSQKQAKKRRREQRAKNQQRTPDGVGGNASHDQLPVRDLEELLKTGSIGACPINQVRFRISSIRAI